MREGGAATLVGIDGRGKERGAPQKAVCAGEEDAPFLPKRQLDRPALFGEGGESAERTPNGVPCGSHCILAAFFCVRPSFLLILLSPVFTSLPCHAASPQTDGIHLFGVLSPPSHVMPSSPLKQSALLLFHLPCRVYVSRIENSCVRKRIGGGSGQRRELI